MKTKNTKKITAVIAAFTLVFLQAAPFGIADDFSPDAFSAPADFTPQPEISFIPETPLNEPAPAWTPAPGSSSDGGDTMTDFMNGSGGPAISAPAESTGDAGSVSGSADNNGGSAASPYSAGSTDTGPSPWDYPGPNSPGEGPGSSNPDAGPADPFSNVDTSSSETDPFSPEHEPLPGPAPSSEPFSDFVPDNGRRNVDPGMTTNPQPHGDDPIVIPIHDPYEDTTPSPMDEFDEALFDMSFGDVWEAFYSYMTLDEFNDMRDDPHEHLPPENPFDDPSIYDPNYTNDLTPEEEQCQGLPGNNPEESMNSSGDSSGNTGSPGDNPNPNDVSGSAPGDSGQSSEPAAPGPENPNPFNMDPNPFIDPSYHLAPYAPDPFISNPLNVEPPNISDPINTTPLDTAPYTSDPLNNPYYEPPGYDPHPGYSPPDGAEPPAATFPPPEANPPPELTSSIDGPV